MKHVVELRAFLDQLAESTGPQIGLVNTNPGLGSYYTTASHFDKPRLMSAQHFIDADTMATHLESLMTVADHEGNDTIVIDLGNLNDVYLKGGGFDYLIRSFGDGNLKFENLKRILLVSAVKRFSLSPATMNFARVHEVVE